MIEPTPIQSAIIAINICLNFIYVVGGLYAIIRGKIEYSKNKILAQGWIARIIGLICLLGFIASQNANKIRLPRHIAEFIILLIPLVIILIITNRMKAKENKM